MSGDMAEFKRRNSRLDPEAAKTGYSALIAAAFVTAVQRRFSESTLKSEVIDYVGELRATSENPSAAIDAHPT